VIFVSIALLVVAGVLLVVGILSSSEPPLVVSIVATLAAGGVLWGSFVHYRKEAVEQGGNARGLGGNQRLEPGYPQAYVSPNGSGQGEPVVMAAPLVARPAAPSVLPDGWDTMTAKDATAMVSTFNLHELHELRRHEVEGEGRKTVMSAIDERIEAIVELRRRVSSSS